MADAYFQIEASKVHRDRAKLSDWFPYEPHFQLWTARNRVRVLIGERPELKGHLRISVVRPLSEKVVDTLTD